MWSYFEPTHGSRVYQYIAAVTANLGIISSQMHYGWSSPSLPILLHGNYSFRITSEEGSWLAVITPLAGVIGAIVTATVVDIFGRKRLIVSSSFPLLASWLMIGFAKSSVLMFIARTIAGISDGISFIVVPMYLGEIAEPRIRGLLGSMCPVSMALAYFLINALGCYLPIDTTAFIATAIPIMLMFTFPWMPESPYFLLMQGRNEGAKQSLRAFMGQVDVEGEFNRISMSVKEQNKNAGQFLDLLVVNGNRKALMIILGLRSVQQLSGTTAVSFYCKTIFEEAKELVSPNVATIVFFTVQLFLSSITSFIVDIFGRRPLLILSATGTSVTLFIIATYLYIKNNTDIYTSSFNFLPLVSLLFYITIFSLGLQTIPLLVIGEVFPTNVKAFAFCLADIYFYIISSIASKFFHATNEAFGMHIPFYSFAGCCLVGLLFIICFVPETKGKTLEDIQKELRGEVKNS